MPSRRRTTSRSDRPPRGASRYGLRPARLAPRTIDAEQRSTDNSKDLRLIHSSPRSRRASPPGQCSVGTGGQSSVGAHTSCCLSLSRFIPTCVGNTAALQVDAEGLDGSSPRAWGTHPKSKGTVNRQPVHPHVRGEHAIDGGALMRKGGSSPRAWGTQAAAQVGRSSCRFIPTCVGNTASSVPSRPRRPVHPHVRGEHQAHGQDVLDEGGSSPRAWGTRDAQPHDRRPRRFIPTCVGNTAAASVDAERDDGSSPRAWGTRR